MGLFSGLQYRPKLKLKVGDILKGQKGNYIAQGHVVFQTPPIEGTKYLWEEWELTGFENYDTWLEYDHYDKILTRYEPIRIPEKFDVGTLKKRQSIRLTLNNQPTYATIEEVGSGHVKRLRGKMSYQLFPDDVIHYAEARLADGRIVSIEDYRQTHDTDFDYYIGTKLTAADQKILFGKRITPFALTPKESDSLSGFFMLAIFGFCLLISVLPHKETVCTTRSVPTTSPSSTVAQTTYSQDCKRVWVFGYGDSSGSSSSGGGGK